MKKITIDSFEHFEPHNYFISVYIAEDEKYERSYSAAVVINTIINGEGLTLSIGCGIMEQRIEDCIVEATHHAIHLFRDFPQDAVLVIDVDGSIEQQLSLETIFKKYNESNKH